jgi:hypothetical protein
MGRWRPVNNLTSFVTTMVALSVGTERVVEILKGMISILRGHDTWIRCVAALAGMGIAIAIGPHSLLDALPDGGFDVPARYLGAAFLGLVASGGSAFWNHALDIIGAVKNVRESLPGAKGPTTPVVQKQG